MMKRYPLVEVKNSITTQFLKIVFSIYLVVALTVTSFHMVAEYYHVKDTIREELKTVQTTIESGLANALWDEYMEQLESILKGTINLPIVVGIKIKNEYGEQAAALGAIIDESGKAVYVDQAIEPSTEREELFWYQAPIVYNYRGQSKKVGEITLYSNAKVVFQRVQLGFVLLMVNAIIKTAALWIIFLWVGRLILSRPLAALTSETEKLKLENLEHARLDINVSTRNELKLLEEAFNTMVQKLLQSREQLNASQQRLELLLQGSHRIAMMHDKLHAIFQTAKFILQGMSSKSSHQLHFGYPETFEEGKSGYMTFQTTVDMSKDDIANSDIENIEMTGDVLANTQPPFVEEHLKNSNQSTSCSIVDDHINITLWHQEQLQGYIQIQGINRAAIEEIHQEYINTLIQFLSITLSSLNYTLDLEEKVRHRTKDLKNKIELIEAAQTQLVQSEKMVGLGTLVAGIAHEINNPTSFVHASVHSLDNDLKDFKTFIFELAGDDADETFTQMFEEKFDHFGNCFVDIYEGTTRIKTIVNDLRIFSRLDEAEQKKANIVEGLRSTLRLIQPQYKKTVHFVCEFSVEPEMECWPSQLNQVFMNMMVNACQAINKRQAETGDVEPGTLTIKTFMHDGQLVISFQDDGCGMTEEVQSKMFDPFYTTKEVGEGTGMGLSISFGIIERHQGRIQVDSIPGVGTNLTIFLPLVLT